MLEIEHKPAVLACLGLSLGNVLVLLFLSFASTWEVRNVEPVDAGYLSCDVAHHCMTWGGCCGVWI